MQILAREGPLSHTSPFFSLVKENPLLFPLIFTLQPRNGENIVISPIPHQILALQIRIPPPFLPEKSQIILMPNYLIDNNSKISTPTVLLTRMEFRQQTDQDVGNPKKSRGRTRTVERKDWTNQTSFSYNRDKRSWYFLLKVLMTFYPRTYNPSKLDPKGCQR